jgi:ABC-type transporter Mla MlaB component
MFALHGMSPGDVVPTRAVLLSHVHAEDRPRVEELLDQATSSSEPLACAYRLVELSGRPRDVALALSRVEAAPGCSTVGGFLVDETERQRRAVAEAVNSELSTALESHATIDRAKGMLMLAYGIDEEAAFQMLRWASQHGNIRLRDLAVRLVDAIGSGAGLGPDARMTIDDVVIAAMRGIELPRQQRAHPTLCLRYESRDDVRVLRATGRVDATTMAELSSALSRLIAVSVDQRVVVDLRGLEDVGTVAMFVLAAAQRRARSSNVVMEVLAPPDGALGDRALGWELARSRDLPRQRA